MAFIFAALHCTPFDFLSRNLSFFALLSLPRNIRKPEFPRKQRCLRLRHKDPMKEGYFSLCFIKPLFGMPYVLLHSKSTCTLKMKLLLSCTYINQVTEHHCHFVFLIGSFDCAGVFNELSSGCIWSF